MRFFCLFVLLIGAMPSGFAQTSTQPTILEYTTPGSSGPGVTVGPDGAIWFALQESPTNNSVKPLVTGGGASAIGRINSVGAISTFSFPGAVCGGAGSIACMALGPDGALWFTQFGANAIARLTTSGVYASYRVITPDPTTAGNANAITTGPDGALWFTESGGNKIGRITTSGAITLYPIPSGGNPVSIATGPDGALWFTEQGKYSIGRITTAGSVTEYPNTSNPLDAFGITSGGDGALWFTEVSFSKNAIGRITTDGEITEYPIPTSNSEPWAITKGADAAVWFTEVAANKIGRITFDGKITEYALSVANSAPGGITTAPDGSIWFTQAPVSEIGHLIVESCQPRVDQGVENIDIDNDGFFDLVANRSTVLRLSGCGRDPAAVQVSFLSSVGVRSNITTNTVNGDEIDFFFSPSGSTDLGKGEIDVADSGGTAIARPLPVDVKQTRSIQFVFFKLDYLDSVPDFVSTVSDSIDYMNGTYPLDPTTFSVRVVPTYVPTLYPAFINSYLPGQIGAWADAGNLWIQKKLLGAERAIAIVPHEWFAYHGLGSGTVGITIGQAPVSFVTDDYPLVTAHEVGHTYTLQHVSSLAAAQTAGYWVQVPKDVSNSLDYMLPGALPGVSGSLVPNPVFPSDDLRTSSKGTERWSSELDFSSLFRSFLVPPQHDPTTLLMTGFIDKNGYVTLGLFYKADKALVDHPLAGPIEVQLIDVKGDVLADVPFGTDFTVYDVDSAISLNSVPFALATAFPKDTDSVQFLYSGQVVSHIRVATKLLQDALNLIPDGEFRRSDLTDRERINQEILEFDKDLAERELRRAIQELRDIRRRLDSQLRDGSEARSPLEFTKQKIINLVDEQLRRLEAQGRCDEKPDVHGKPQ